MGLFRWIKSVFTKPSVPISVPQSRSLEALAPWFMTLWQSCEIRPERLAEAKKLYAKMLLHKSTYDYVEAKTGVPWIVVAGIHEKEGSMRFDRNLHNGQRLNQVTTIVPKGRGPFNSFEESAVDALIGEHAHSKKYAIDRAKKANWSIEACLWFCHNYNGWGYLNKNIYSPYLWCGTNHYTKGGYYADGKYSSEHVIQNLGIAVILKLRLDAHKTEA